jgi:hypothetical protein
MTSFVAEPRNVRSLNGHAGPCMFERCERRAYVQIEWRIVDGEQRLVDGEHAHDYGIALAWYCDAHAPKATS